MRWRFATTLALLTGLSPAAAQEPAPVAVAWPEAEEARRSLELTGSFVARRAARLSPRIPGLVAEAPVDAGDRVAAGAVLLQLDTRLAELELGRAEARRDEARARLVEAERLRDEARRLAGDRFVAETEIEARQAQVVIATAGLAVAENALATARERLERHAVLAPFPGVVGVRLAEVGEWVETGTPVLELVGVDALWLDVRAPQQYFAALGGAVEATVRVDALGGRAFPARIHARVPVSDPGARTFLLRLVPAEAPASIVPGMSAAVRLSWAAGREVIYVPRDAIIRFPDGSSTVWVVDEAEGRPTAHEVQVRVSGYEGDRAEIAAGLDGNRPVVVRGNEVLREGQPVRVVEGRG